MAKVFVDASVFLYAVGGEGPHREACRDFLSAVGDGRIDGVTNTEVLQEVLHVRARRVSIKDATTAVRAAAGIVTDVLPVTQEDVLDACALLESHPKLGARDALHAAVMHNARIGVIVSIDRDFDSLKRVKRLSPSEACAR